MKPKSLPTDDNEAHNLGIPISVDETVGAGSTVFSRSPVVGRSSTRRTRSLDHAREHDDLCGCHGCFLALCHQLKSITKDNLIVLIRKFINERHNKSSALDSHILYVQ